MLFFTGLNQPGGGEPTTEITLSQARKLYCALSLPGMEVEKEHVLSEGCGLLNETVRLGGWGESSCSSQLMYVAQTMIHCINVCLSSEALWSLQAILELTFMPLVD